MARQAAASDPRTSLLKIGVLRSIPNAIIAAAIRATLDQERSTRIEVLEGTERELLGLLARGRIDVALTTVGHGGDRFLEEELFDEGYAVAFSRGHRLTGRLMIAGEALADEVMIVRRHCEALAETSRHFTDRGVRPRFAYRSTNDGRVLDMVAAGLGITIMPASYRHEAIVFAKMTGFDHRRRIGLVFGKQAETWGSEPSPLVSAVRTVLGAFTRHP
ncbi:LysR family transcriptional regulator substrate-binding protein [uncultured Sphingomonas sp.]|uniref:LysR family transcriptional regulator substrate-binding protein n=1 Tax=uncultured Sphingomonas sp. TaxID=158754 RepID=UPI0035CB9002